MIINDHRLALFLQNLGCVWLLTSTCLIAMPHPHPPGLHFNINSSTWLGAIFCFHVLFCLVVPSSGGSTPSLVCVVNSRNPSPILPWRCCGCKRQQKERSSPSPPPPPPKGPGYHSLSGRQKTIQWSGGGKGHPSSGRCQAVSMIPDCPDFAKMGGRWFLSHLLT